MSKVLESLFGTKTCSNHERTWTENTPTIRRFEPGSRDAIAQTPESHQVITSTTAGSTAITKRQLTSGTTNKPTAGGTLPRSGFEFHDGGRTIVPESDDLGKSPEMSSNVSHRYDTS